MKIQWKKTVLDEDGMWTGHGLCIFRGDLKTRERCLLVAFVPGFEWMRGGTDAVVKFLPKRFPAEPVETEKLTGAIEMFLRERRVHGEVATGHLALANA
jgi:hypothetical protein